MKHYFSKAYKTQPQGLVQLIIGPMFAGKTSELIRRIKRFQISGAKCILFKWSKDDRNSKIYQEQDDLIINHDKEVKFQAERCISLMEQYDKALDYDVIGVDEGHFFEDIVSFSDKLANNKKIVIVSALDATYQREPFLEICKLVAKSEDVSKLTSVCVQCGTQAAFSFRTTSETNLKVVGGLDKYIPLCRQCYLDNLRSNAI